MGHGRLRNLKTEWYIFSRRSASFRVMSDIGRRGKRWRWRDARGVRPRETSFEPDTSRCEEALMPLSKHRFNPILVSQCIFTPQPAHSLFATAGLHIRRKKVIEKSIPVMLEEIPGAILMFGLGEGEIVSRGIWSEDHGVVENIRWVWDGTRPIFKVCCSRWKMMVVLKHGGAHVTSTEVGLEIDMEVFCRDCSRWCVRRG